MELNKRLKMRAISNVSAWRKLFESIVKIMYGDEIIRALVSSGQKCGARGATEAAGHEMRGILEHFISAGVVSDDEKNAFPSMNHLAILIGCLLITPGLSRHLVSIYEASQKPCSIYKI